MTGDAPHVAVAQITVNTPDGTFPAHSPGFPVGPVRYRLAQPDPAYVETALAALLEACVELGVSAAYVGFVRRAGLPLVSIAPGAGAGLTGGGLAVGGPELVFGGFFSDAWPAIVFIVVDATPTAQLRSRVRHEAAHLQYHRIHPEDSGGHEGPSETFARSFEGD